VTARLNDKVALITGAGTGIGRAIALAFAREGTRVSLMGRRKPLLEAVASEIGNKSLVIEADVSKKADIDRALEQTVSHFGKLNVLVNNAGVMYPGTAEQTTEAQWDEMFNVNLRGLWQLSVAAEAPSSTSRRCLA
jgi:NAD(P)-dependent dehydrogenase (short-subunit alcohol dehydrogenase family)